LFSSKKPRNSFPKTTKKNVHAPREAKPSRELFKQEISENFRFSETISTFLDPNPDPPTQLNPDLIESETLF
jgi:hypothetical protein